MSVTQIIGQPIGEMDSGSPVTRRTLTATRILYPPGLPNTRGFTQTGQAESWARREDTHTIIAIVGAGRGHEQRFHAIDTGTAAPNPPFNLAVRWNQSVRPVSFVQWIGVPEAVAPAAPARAPRIVGSAPPSVGSRRFDQTFTSLTADERRRIHSGVGTCLLYHTYLLEVFYNAWADWNCLEISDSMGNRDGLTRIGGMANSSFTRINRILMRGLESRLGGVMLHEMMHFRQPRSAFNTASDSQEGEGWATQVFFSDYVGDEAESNRLTGMIQNNFGGEVDHPPAARIHCDLVYAASGLLMDVFDAAAGRRAATFTQQQNPAEGNEGSFALQLMTSNHWWQHPHGAPVYEYLRDQSRRDAVLRNLRQHPPGALAIYPTRRLRESIR